MARRTLAYAFDETTIPATIPIDNVDTPVTGVKTTYNPLAFWCKCGHGVQLRQKDYYMSFDGYVCPNCGITHKQSTIIDKVYGGELTYHKWEFANEREVIMRQIKYKLDRPGTNLLRFVKEPDQVRVYPIAQALRERSISSNFINQLITEHADDLDPMLLKLLQVGQDDYSSGWAVQNYYDKLTYAKNLYESNPALFVPLMEALKGASITYQQFEDMYPSYLLPLTKKLIKDYNPYEDRNRTWSKPYVWNKESVYKNYEALTCVVNYYHSGLISFSQMQKILEYPEALNNPTFICAFKAHFMQMEAFVRDIKNEGQNPQAASLDVKEYYTNNTKNFFMEQGYTFEQVEEAFASPKGDYLDILIRMGATRRKRGTSKSD